MIRLKQFTGVPNAGDAASQFIVGSLLGELVKTSSFFPSRHANLIAIGSILEWSDSNSVVWGSGFMYETSRLRDWQRPRAVLAVRGPLTARKLREQGIPAPSVLGDPGILISDLIPSSSASRDQVGVVPHYTDMQHPFIEESRRRGARIIDPGSPLEIYLEELSGSSLIISSSLHGVIFAHSYGIPAVWIRLSDRVGGDGFKFRDYYESVGIAGSEVIQLTSDVSFDEAVSAAALPAEEVDRDALREALLNASSMVVRESPGGLGSSAMDLATSLPWRVAVPLGLVNVLADLKEGRT